MGIFVFPSTHPFPQKPQLCEANVTLTPNPFPRGRGCRQKAAVFGLCGKDWCQNAAVVSQRYYSWQTLFHYGDAALPFIAKPFCHSEHACSAILNTALLSSSRFRSVILSEAKNLWWGCRSGIETAVDGDDFAGDVGGFGGGEEANHRGHLFRFAEAGCRDVLFQGGFI